METIKLMLSSLAEKDKPCRAELELLSKAIETLTDEEKEEVKEEVAEIEVKVDEAEKEAETTENETLKAKKEAEKLSKLAKDKDSQIEKLSKDVAKAHSEIDKMKSEVRMEKIKLSVKQLADDAKIIGENIEEKTVEMLSNLSEEKADQMIEFLSSQPSRIEKGELGVSTTPEKTESSPQELLSKARKLKEEGDTRDLTDIIETL